MLVYCVYMYCLIVFVSVDYMYVCVCAWHQICISPPINKPPWLPQENRSHHGPYLVSNGRG